VKYDLCAITQEVDRLDRGHVDVARAALAGGATMIQLRDKELSSRDLFEVARQIRALTQQHGAAFIVNDRADIALAVEADGVHLGERDLPIASARRLLGPGAEIGASVDTPEAARIAAASGATYLGVGPIYATGSKPDAGHAIGLDPIGRLKTTVDIPLLAIGGLTCDNVEGTIRAGADGIAVISAVSQAPDMVGATAQLLQRIQAAKQARDDLEQLS
jgi:thiamine-phosphate pyrophosphorylase